MSSATTPDHPEPGSPVKTKHRCIICRTMLHTRHGVEMEDGSKPLICHQCGAQSTIPAREIRLAKDGEE